MARRREKSVFETLAVAPWWVSAGVAVAVFIGAKFFSPLIHSESPVLAGVNVLAAIAQQHAHLFALPFVVVSLIAAGNAYYRRRLFDRQSGLDSIRNMSWQDFELFIGEAFRREGFAIEENGGGGADGGVDLRLRRDDKIYVVQCKRWKTRQVGVSAVRELFGVMAAERAYGAIFVSSGSYTADAVKFAEDNGVVLIDSDMLAEIIERSRKLQQHAATSSMQKTQIQNCPKCNAPMVVRTAKRGAQEGEQFLGCSSFPICRSTLALPNA